MNVLEMTLKEFRKIQDDDIERIRAAWPGCVIILREAVKKMQAEMEKVAPSDGAYNLINALVMHEIFWRKTVAAVIDRDDADVLGWVKEEWDDWNK